MADSLTIRRPDDWHVHLRDGNMLRGVVAHTARQFGRAIVMPNLSPPVTTAGAARDYRDRIVAALPAGVTFEPLMTAYLTDHTDPADLVAGKADGVLTAAKLYPANATTNSAHGVSDIERLWPVFAAMERAAMVLCVHGEVTDPEVDVFDREAVFIERHLARIVRDFPELKLVLEHVTTIEGVGFVEGSSSYVAGTITPQHLHINRNAMLVGGIRPHAYCLPVAKREAHRLALRKAATSGSGDFFLGTDSAPHARGDKEFGVWLRGHLQRALRTGKLCAGVRRGRCARPAGKLRLARWARVLPAAATCRHRHARAAGCHRARNDRRLRYAGRPVPRG